MDLIPKTQREMLFQKRKEELEHLSKPLKVIYRGGGVSLWAPPYPYKCHVFLFDSCPYYYYPNIWLNFNLFLSWHSKSYKIDIHLFQYDILGIDGLKSMILGDHAQLPPPSVILLVIFAILHDFKLRNYPVKLLINTWQKLVPDKMSTWYLIKLVPDTMLSDLMLRHLDMGRDSLQRLEQDYVSVDT